MTLDDMIAVLEAAKRGERIEACAHGASNWFGCTGDGFNTHEYDYRIAPKKEMTLVEELRAYADQVGRHGDLFISAADRIEELEKSIYNPSVWHTDELLAELKRRTT